MDGDEVRGQLEEVEKGLTAGPAVRGLSHSAGILTGIQLERKAFRKSGVGCHSDGPSYGRLRTLSALLNIK